MKHNHEECLKNCLECFKICNQTLVHCLEMGGKHSQKSHINLMISCAQICEFHAKLMMRNCGYSPKVALICAEACKDCADDCEKVDGQDEMMKKCIEACRRCEKSCTEESHSH